MNTNQVSKRRRASSEPFHWIVPATVLLVMAGCARPALRTYYLDQQDKRLGNGLYYAVPLGKVQILAVRQDVIYTNNSITNLTFFTNVTLLTTNYPYSITTAVSSTNTSYATNSNGTNIAAGSGGGGSLTNMTNMTLLVLATTNVVTNFASQILGTTVFSNATVVQGLPTTTTNYYYNITVQTEYDPDPANMYLLRPTLNLNYDDSLGVQVGANGLLNSISANNADRTGDIIAQVATDVASALQLALGGAPSIGGRFEAPVTKQKPVPPRFIEVVFDPFKPDEVTAAANALANGEMILETDGFSDVSSTTFVDYKDKHGNSGQSVDGILYRPLRPLTISVHSGDGNRVSQTVLLPDKSRLLIMKVKKYALVDTVTQVTLTNGVVTGFSVNKPSQLLAALKIPMDVISAFASIPTNLLQLKFDIASAQGNLLAQQSNNVNTMIGLINAQNALNAAQKTSGAPKN